MHTIINQMWLTGLIGDTQVVSDHICSFVFPVLVWMDEYQRCTDISAPNVGLHSQLCNIVCVFVYFVIKYNYECYRPKMNEYINFEVSL